MSMEAFHPAVAAWFNAEFAAATSVQQRAWEAIKSGRHTLISAPTGSGKTLAAFMSVIDDLVRQSLAGELVQETRVLYVSPLKALSNDVQKNLQAPLLGIRRELLERGLPDAPIQAWVRTGDTPQSERARMRRRPPHILVTTPESLYILLTSAGGRDMLRSVRTVIVDEIHALAGNKRGAHLALSLERLAALTESALVRVGVSATTKPIEAMARFLTGERSEPCDIVDEGHVRDRDLALELPSSPLEAVMAGEVWAELYDRLAALVREHRTTLIFVNTRRLAERAARHLAERLGEDQVTAHHGSLAKEHRLNAEARLKAGGLKALVATASLELGIDIGEVDLVCQLGSPRGIATLLQRVGRSGHGLGRLPKGRLFPLSRDELVECTALLASVRLGELDAIKVCACPLDVLAQQIVAEVGMREWGVRELYDTLRRAASYRSLEEPAFLAVLDMLAEGFSTHRGRRAAHIHYDRVNARLRGRRGAQLTAITNGGVIPDQFDYDVLLQPAEQFVGTLNEDFAFESLPGDIFQLGNTSYRILKVESGRVHVADAHGQPPSIPFWFGEAPGRSDELSAAVSRLHQQVEHALATESPDQVALTLAQEHGLAPVAAEQLVDYLAAAHAALGGLPSAERIILERFFDEAGDAHLVIHSTLGSRLNRAWGLALRKRFCRRFNFELQAAALEDSIVISLGAVHSFPLEEVMDYLHSASVRDVLTQAVLAAPVFPGRWRWNATTALAIRRFRNGKRAPAQFQRSDAEDLLATVFPDQLACAENIVGEREIPDHPLVSQTLSDCLSGIMDIEGLEQLLRGLEGGRVEVLARELTNPSPLAQEVLVAKPYAFLDDAPAEERRTLAVQTRRYMSVEQAAELGRLDPAAIARVRREAWPDPRDLDEMHDALCLIGFVTEQESASAQRWGEWLAALRAAGRATTVDFAAGRLWVSAERLPELEIVLPEAVVQDRLVVLGIAPADRDAALRELVRSRLEALGPVTAESLAAPLAVSVAEVEIALAALEREGVVMRGAYSGAAATEWCERRLLARIHRYTLNRLRSEIEPVSLAEYQRYLFRWQGLGTERRSGREALGAVLGELQGLVLPAAAWEREVLPSRIADYDRHLIDALSQAGEIVWWRPCTAASDALQRPTTIAASPIAMLPRQTLAHWRVLTAAAEPDPQQLSSAAQRVLSALESQGALFFVELVQASGLLRVQVEEALSELVARGLVTADAFQGLRVLLTAPSRRRGFARRGRGGPSFDEAGRWARVRPLASDDPKRDRAQAVEHAARSVLARYGVVCRAVLGRESALPSWREMLGCFRRWEASGEIRGGRFVAALGGEQYALASAVEMLRRVRRDPREEWLVVSAADPLNLVGLLGGGARIPALASHRVLYKDGVPVAASGARGPQWLAELGSEEQARARSLLVGEQRPQAPRRTRTRRY